MTARRYTQTMASKDGREFSAGDWYAFVLGCVSAALHVDIDRTAAVAR